MCYCTLSSRVSVRLVMVLLYTVLRAGPPCVCILLLQYCELFKYHGFTIFPELFKYHDIARIRGVY